MNRSRKLMTAGGALAVAAGTWLAAPPLRNPATAFVTAEPAEPEPLAFTVRTNGGGGEMSQDGPVLWQVVVGWEPQPFVNYVVERRDLVITQWSLVQRVESAGATNYATAIGYPVLVSDPGEWRVREE